MAEYIEKQAALDAILREPPDAHYPSWYAAKIKMLPAADVVPVVHGRWLHSGYTDHLEVVKCSECNHEAFAISLYVCDGNYCPNCGARMDGGADND